MSETHINVNTPGEHLIKLVTLQPRDLDRAPIKRTVLDLPSFTAYLAKHTQPQTAGLFYTKAGVVCLIQDRADLKPGADPDSVKFDFTRPAIARKWLKAIGSVFKHEDFREFLEERFQEISGSAVSGFAGADLLKLVTTFSISKTFQYDATLNDRNNYKVGIESSAGGDTVKIPKWVVITIPLIEGLNLAYNITAKLEFTAPKTEGEKPTFKLVAPDLEDVFEQAAKDAMALVADKFPDHLITYGFTGDGNRPDGPAF